MATANAGNEADPLQPVSDGYHSEEESVVTTQTLSFNTFRSRLTPEQLMDVEHRLLHIDQLQGGEPKRAMPG